MACELGIAAPIEHPLDDPHRDAPWQQQQPNLQSPAAPLRDISK